MAEPERENPAASRTEFVRSIRDIFSGSLPSEFQTEPFTNLRPTIRFAQDGDWQAFDRQPRKLKMFALQAILIESWWANEVTDYRERHAEVHGLSTYDTNDHGRFIRPLTPDEWSTICSLPDEQQRWRITATCQQATFLRATIIFDRRMRSPGGDLVVNGRGAFHHLLQLMDVEVPGVSSVPTLYIDTLRAGFDNASTFLWGFQNSIASDVATGVALSHGAAFSVAMQMFNAAQAAQAEAPFRERDAALAAFREAAKADATQSRIRQVLRENREINNSSYHPLTCGCPAFYTPAFDGLIAWVTELRKALQTR